MIRPKSFTNKLRCLTLKGHPVKAAVTVVASTIAVVAMLSSSAHAGAKHIDLSLVPPPPATPLLMVPPPPVMLPYSYVLTAPPAAEIVKPVTILKPQPQPHPRPIGTHPTFAPCLNLAYAKTRGFGSPRLANAGTESLGPGAAEAFPSIQAPAINTWFEPSLRWYVNRVNTQYHYQRLSQQSGNASDGANSQLIADASGSYSAPPRHRKATHIKLRKRHAKRTYVDR